MGRRGPPQPILIPLAFSDARIVVRLLSKYKRRRFPARPVAGAGQSEMAFMISGIRR
jgi:hypothetical protein